MKLKHPDKNWQSTLIEDDRIPKNIIIKLISSEGIAIGINIKFGNNILKIGALSDYTMLFPRPKIIYDIEEDSKSEFDDIEILNNISDSRCAYNECLYKVESIILGQEVVCIIDIIPKSYMHKDCYLKWIKTS